MTTPVANPSTTVSEFRSLTGQEALERLKEVGYNELPTAKPRTILQIAGNVMREPMLLLLVACAVIYLVLGDAREATILGSLVVVVIGITLYQEQKTERALDALRDLSSPRALVIRDGSRIRIAGREVVPGDLLVVSEGDRVAADGVLLRAANLSTDESLLTGESVPVRKSAGEDSGNAMPRPSGEDLPFVYSGTLVVRGHGIARVKATGIQTELGKIGKSLANVEQEPTLLQQDARRIVRIVASGAVALCALLVVAYGLLRGGWLRGFLAGLTLAMAILPEELPVVLTIFLALGAWRLSKLGVLARNMPAIETLGAASILCVDKTGTLTLNQMAIQKLFAQGESFDVTTLGLGTRLPETFHELVEFGLLATRTEGFDPMDIGVRRFGEMTLEGTEHLHGDWLHVREYPLAPGLLAMSEVWRSPGRDRYVIAAKGAPEAILDLCHLPPDKVQALNGQVIFLASQGLRVLGVAKAYFAPALPGHQHDFPFEFVGLLALADPVRPTVPAAVHECRDAGIRVVMITGDYPATAMSIARQSGLPDSGVLSGAELDVMPDALLQERIRSVNVCARAMPDQKLRLVKALKAIGGIVAMTGDGVNDAPALKSAHIGIAMGERGTDVAREASDLVLLKDDFASIVHSVRMGRRVFDNLKKAMMYIFAIHVPIAGLSVLPVLFQWPLILEPVHIAFLELIIDPACSIVFEAESEEPDIMNRPPRPLVERLFSRKTVVLSLLQGLGILCLLLAVFATALYRGQGAEDARALTFTSLVMANLTLIHANRSWSRHFFTLSRSPSAAMGWVAGGATLFLGASLYLPALRRLFDFSFLHANDIAICLAAGVVSATWFELLKVMSHRYWPTTSV
jgi:Ca2+-transporting ATPase